MTAFLYSDLWQQQWAQALASIVTALIYANELGQINWSVLDGHTLVQEGQPNYTSRVFFFPQGGLLIYNNQVHACCWQGHDTLTCVAYMWKALTSVHSLVLLSSLPPGGLDCPAPTVTPRPPLCGAETPRASLCAMPADSTWSSMGCATYSALCIHLQCLVCTQSQLKKLSRGEGMEVKDLIFVYARLWI